MSNGMPISLISNSPTSYSPSSARDLSRTRNDVLSIISQIQNNPRRYASDELARMNELIGSGVSEQTRAEAQMMANACREGGYQSPAGQWIAVEGRADAAAMFQALADAQSRMLDADANLRSPVTYNAVPQYCARNVYGCRPVPVYESNAPVYENDNRVAAGVGFVVGAVAGAIVANRNRRAYENMWAPPRPVVIINDHRYDRHR